MKKNRQTNREYSYESVSYKWELCTDLSFYFWVAGTYPSFHLSRVWVPPTVCYHTLTPGILVFLVHQLTCMSVAGLLRICMTIMYSQSTTVMPLLINTFLGIYIQNSESCGETGWKIKLDLLFSGALKECHSSNGLNWKPQCTTLSTIKGFEEHLPGNCVVKMKSAKIL